MKPKPIRFVRSSETVDTSSGYRPRADGTETRTFYEDVVNSAPQSTVSATPAVETTPTLDVNAMKSRSGRSRSRRSTSDSTHDPRRLLFHSQHGDVESLRRCLASTPPAGDTATDPRPTGVATRVDVDWRDGFGWTALMAASAAGNADCARLLLDYGASTATRDFCGRTPRSLAFAHPEVLALLTPSTPSPPQTAPSSPEPGLEDCAVCDEPAVPGCQHRRSIVHQLNALEKREASADRPRRYRSYGIAADNRGFAMLERAGWRRDLGLGARHQGQAYPVKTRLKRDRRGVGGEEGKRRITHPDEEVMRSGYYHRDGRRYARSPRTRDVASAPTRYLSAEENKSTRERLARRFRREFNEID